MRYYIVDAFADRLFQGNQAGVCLLESPIGEQLMQDIAIENNLAETAYILPEDDFYRLRWFTPEGEIDLCGHATLASAYVVANFVDPRCDTIRFETMSGTLTVTRGEGNRFEMDFPSRMPQPIEVIPQMSEAIGVPVLEAHLHRDMVLLVENEQAVLAVKPKEDIMAAIPRCECAVVTAKGERTDFVSRVFTPGAAVFEDPVTGSTHAELIPFWAQRLGKTEMVARQLSRRGGTLHCKDLGSRVRITGKAVLYLQGALTLTGES